MKINVKTFFITINLLLIATYSLAQIDEKEAILASYPFGDFEKAKQIKKSGEIVLKVWAPILHYRKAPRQGVESIKIEYDEILIWVRNDLFTPSEKMKFKIKSDIHKIYFNKNQVQAFTCEKYFISNPINGKKVEKYKIVMIFDRNQILNELK